jgi:hypothetical protein
LANELEEASTRVPLLTSLLRLGFTNSPSRCRRLIPVAAGPEIAGRAGHLSEVFGSIAV